MAVLASNLDVHARNGVLSRTSWEDIVAPVRPFLDRVSERLAEQADAFNDKLAELGGTGGMVMRLVGPLLPMTNGHDWSSMQITFVYSKSVYA